MRRKKIINKARLHAFTLIEILITMILTGIIAAVAYISYEITIKQFSLFQKNNQQLIMIAQLNTALQNDFHECDVVYYSNNEINFQNKYIQPVKYAFAPGYILRIASGVKDTFFIPKYEETSSFQEKLYTSSSDMIDRLELSTTINESPVKFQYIKKYGADWLMNYEIKNKQSTMKVQ